MTTTATSRILCFKQNTMYRVSPSLSSCYERLMEYLYETEDMFSKEEYPTDQMHRICLQVASWLVHQRPQVIVIPCHNSICSIPTPHPSHLFRIISEYICGHRKGRNSSKKLHYISSLEDGCVDKKTLIISTHSSLPIVERNLFYASCLSFVRDNVVSKELDEIRFAVSCWIGSERARCACVIDFTNSWNERVIYHGIKVSSIFEVLCRDVRRVICSVWKGPPHWRKPSSSLRLSKSGFGLRTRCQSETISKCIANASRSKDRIQYRDGKRHCLGEPVKLTVIPSLLTKTVAPCTLPDSVLGQRLLMLKKLESIHATLLYIGVDAPRDNWEDWINNAKNFEDCDVAFMALIIIIMSSSTSDSNLANIVPLLFSAGLTSARGVVEIVQQYGEDSLCSLMSGLGRFYQNTERIVNAADYFIQFHKGTIPEDVTIPELCSLLGVGYKTANIVVATAFKRIDGIPSDKHVIRWSALLGWTTSTSLNGLECSKQLEQWLPKSYWGSINPLFGSLGQLITRARTRKKLFSVIFALNDAHLVQLFKDVYKHYRKKGTVDPT